MTKKLKELCSALIVKPASNLITLWSESEINVTAFRKVRNMLFVYPVRVSHNMKIPVSPMSRISELNNMEPTGFVINHKLLEILSTSELSTILGPWLLFP